MYLGKSLYYPVVHQATARQYTVQSLLRLFHCVHCRVCPAERVFNCSVPILIFFMLYKKLIWPVHAFAQKVSALDSKGWTSKEFVCSSLLCIQDNHRVCACCLLAVCTVPFEQLILGGAIPASTRRVIQFW